MFEFSDFGPSKLPEGFVESLGEKSVEELIEFFDRDIYRIYVDAVCGELASRPKTPEIISVLIRRAEDRDKYAEEILAQEASKEAFFEVLLAPVSMSLRLEAASRIESFLSGSDAHIFDSYNFVGELYDAVSALKGKLFELAEVEEAEEWRKKREKRNAYKWK